MLATKNNSGTNGHSVGTAQACLHCTDAARSNRQSVRTAQACLHCTDAARSNRQSVGTAQACLHCTDAARSNRQSVGTAQACLHCTDAARSNRQSVGTAQACLHCTDAARSNRQSVQPRPVCTVLMQLDLTVSQSVQPRPVCTVLMQLGLEWKRNGKNHSTAKLIYPDKQTGLVFAVSIYTLAPVHFRKGEGAAEMKTCRLSVGLHSFHFYSSSRWEWALNTTCLARASTCFCTQGTEYLKQVTQSTQFQPACGTSNFICYRFKGNIYL